MEILKKGRDGVAACNVEVASWDDVPAFPGDEDGDDLIASQHRGVCLRCQKDIDRQMAHAGADATVADVVPKWSFLNVMDPLYKFPFEMQQLFDMATPTEAMLVALEHMQVSYTTVSRTGLSKFRRNVISFQQDIAGFAKRVGLLQRYEVGDRVNSSPGPGDDPLRPVKRARDASAEEREKHGWTTSDGWRIRRGWWKCAN